MSEVDQHYRALGLEPGAAPEVVKQAYRDLVKVWHPDRFPNDTRLQQKAQEELKAINIAYHALIGHHAEPHFHTFSETPQPRPPSDKGSAHRHESSQRRSTSAFESNASSSGSASAAVAVNPAIYDWFFRVSKILAMLLSLNLIRLLFVHCGAE